MSEEIYISVNNFTACHANPSSPKTVHIFSVRLTFTYIRLSNAYFASPLIFLLQYSYQNSFSNLRNNDSFSRLNNTFHSHTLVFLVPFQRSAYTS